ncbi:MAG: TRAP transporter small permease subunit [Desulfobacterales bacterium]|nr:MAG: TRAP transporter small permease subunit [Desulfobacterales bacterium]
MEKALRKYQKIMELLSNFILALAAIVVGLDVLSLFLEAVGRYVVGSSRAFMEEFPRLLVPFIVFPMMGVLLRLKKHINVEILPERLTGKSRSLLLIVVYSLVIAVAIQFLIAGIIAVQRYYDLGYETHTEIVFKLWATYLPFPIGFGLLILFALEALWSELATLINLRGPDK